MVHGVLDPSTRATGKNHRWILPSTKKIQSQTQSAQDETCLMQKGSLILKRPILLFKW
jgi:hypothetical protein